jgi:hypothetical protein
MFRTAICIALMLQLLSGCGEETVAVSIVGYNHTGNYIHSFTVNGGSAGNLFAHSGGGSIVCCVAIPEKWKPGLKAKIGWMNEDESWNEVVVDIPKYSPELGDFQVHIFDNKTTKVFVFNGGPKAPGHPLKGKEAEL